MHLTAQHHFCHMHKNQPNLASFSILSFRFSISHRHTQSSNSSPLSQRQRPEKGLRHRLLWRTTAASSWHSNGPGKPFPQTGREEGKFPLVHQEIRKKEMKKKNDWLCKRGRWRSLLKICFRDTSSMQWNRMHYWRRRRSLCTETVFRWKKEMNAWFGARIKRSRSRCLEIPSCLCSQFNKQKKPIVTQGDPFEWSQSIHLHSRQET